MLTVAGCLESQRGQRNNPAHETWIVEGEKKVAHSLKAEGADASEDGTGRGTPLVTAFMAARRLTPRECERLQGFPDDYTLVPYRGKPASDSARYKALGNSMAVNVMSWIGRRIAMVDNFVRERSE